MTKQELSNNYDKIRKSFNVFSPFGKLGCGIYDVVVKFKTTNVDGVPIRQLMSVGALSEDWYGACDFCPENDAVIEFLELSYGDRVEKIKEKYLVDFRFEDMMAIIEEVWP